MRPKGGEYRKRRLGVERRKERSRAQPSMGSEILIHTHTHARARRPTPMGVYTTSRGALRGDIGKKKRERKKEKKRRPYGLYFQRDAGAVTATVGDETVREARRDARGPRVCTRDTDPPPTRRKSRIVILARWKRIESRSPDLFLRTVHQSFPCPCPGLRLFMQRSVLVSAARPLVHLPLYILEDCVSH